ncbi:MAG: hypothetical protein AB7P98_17995, partial [Parvularculaceae bacterium]
RRRLPARVFPIKSRAGALDAAQDKIQDSSNALARRAKRKSLQSGGALGRCAAAFPPPIWKKPGSTPDILRLVARTGAARAPSLGERPQGLRSILLTVERSFWTLLDFKEGLERAGGRATFFPPAANGSCFTFLPPSERILSIALIFLHKNVPYAGDSRRTPLEICWPPQLARGGRSRWRRLPSIAIETISEQRPQPSVHKKGNPHDQKTTRIFRSLRDIQV